MPLSEIKPGMKATAWTVFQGTEPEAVPIEIIGRYKNQWGPKQDIILGKMGGKAIRTNVAGGMSGSPVYIDGKLIGAVALRLSTFSPDAICGITPIEYMLEINDYDPPSRRMRTRLTRSGSTIACPRRVTCLANWWRPAPRAACRRRCRRWSRSRRRWRSRASAIAPCASSAPSSSRWAFRWYRAARPRATC